MQFDSLGLDVAITTVFVFLLLFDPSSFLLSFFVPFLFDLFFVDVG